MGGPHREDDRDQLARRLANQLMVRGRRGGANVWSAPSIGSQSLHGLSFWRSPAWIEWLFVFGWSLDGDVGNDIRRPTRVHGVVNDVVVAGFRTVKSAGKAVLRRLLPLFVDGARKGCSKLTRWDSSRSVGSRSVESVLRNCRPRSRSSTFRDPSRAVKRTKPEMHHCSPLEIFWNSKL